MTDNQIGCKRLHPDTGPVHPHAGEQYISKKKLHNLTIPLTVSLFRKDTFVHKKSAGTSELLLF